MNHTHIDDWKKHRLKTKVEAIPAQRGIYVVYRHKTALYVGCTLDLLKSVEELLGRGFS